MLLLGVIVLCTSLSAQNRVITGRVTDEGSNAVPNASVRVKGTTLGTTTDASGAFTINVPSSGRVLLISSVGFGEQEITIGNQSIVNVSLKNADRGLQEVVVVGYQQRRKRDEAGAISTIRANEIQNLPVASLDKAMQGKAAGVVVQANNGIPGGSINVRIRGTGSIKAGNDPLYVVDGVQLNNRNDANFTQSNPLAFLNPNDIESIDILKDAASAAIYGATASNGVVIITTKKGRSGKTKFQFNTYMGVASPLKKLDVTNTQEFLQLRAEALANNQNLSPNSLTIKRSVLTEARVTGASTFNDKQADSAFTALPTYDWQNAAFRNGLVKNYELSASGGNEKTTFRVSSSFNKQEAIVTKADFQRAGINFNLTNKATERLTITTGLNLSTFQQNLPFAIEGSFLGSPAFSASGILPYNPIYNQDGSYFGIPGQTPFSSLSGVLNQNIIAVNDFNKGYQRTNQAIGNISGDYKLFDWLSFRTFYALDYRLVQGKLYRDPRTPDGFNRKGVEQTQSTWNTNILTDQLLMLNHDFSDKHHVDGVFGYEYKKENNEGISAVGEGFASPQFQTLNSAATATSIGEFFSGFRRQSVFGSLNYNFAGRYLVGTSLRYDGSSRFGEKHRYGLFPAIKVAWNIDRESFMETNKTLSTLRFRVGYGETGNDQIGNFDALGLYSSGVVYNTSPGISFTQLANPDLKWENNHTTNAGIDFGFLRNRITGAIEVYDKRTSDLLLDQPVSYTTGFPSIVKNVGKVRNKGIELTIGGTPFKARKTGDFNWLTSFVFGYNKNSVTSLYNGLQVLSSDVSVRVGEALGTVFTQRYAGVNAATGRPMWYDSLGNTTYQPQGRDRVIIGTTNPKITGGFTNTLSYKGFSADIFFQYQYGAIATDGQINFLKENIARINELKDVYDNRWTKPGQVTSFPRMNAAGAEVKGSGAGTGDRNYFKTDYIRLKNVRLAYELPNSLITKAKLTSVSFYVQGTNLYTYAPGVRSYDIEFQGSGTGIIPQSKNVTIGLQVGF